MIATVATLIAAVLLLAVAMYLVWTGKGILEWVPLMDVKTPAMVMAFVFMSLGVTIAILIVHHVWMMAL